VTGADAFKRKGWYLVSSNHQSWVDILVLQRTFNGRIPLLKFFIKHELIYVPIIGLAWWALDFPFMRRKGGSSARKDLEAARKACEKFRVVPTSVISFLEGTRFSKAKHDQQKSTHQHLLKPKTGGIAMALETLGDKLETLVDVTIVYPNGVPEFSDLMCGRVREVIVTVRQVPIPADLHVAEDGTDSAYRQRLQAWINALWDAKDREISAIKAR
jgi:1-acyl-sn-glycerol-3-phosphate acyltransferase